LKITSVGGVARSAGVGLLQRSKTPLKSPLIQGGTPFSSSAAPQSGMTNFFDLTAWLFPSVSHRRRCPLRRFTQLQFDASMTEKE